MNLARAVLARLAADVRGVSSVSPGALRSSSSGCGRGAVLLTLAAAFPRSRFTGLDRSAGAIADAARLAWARRLENAVFRVIDAGLAPDVSACDAVISDGAITWN